MPLYRYIDIPKKTHFFCPFATTQDASSPLNHRCVPLCCAEIRKLDELLICCHFSYSLQPYSLVATLSGDDASCVVATGLVPPP